MMSCASSKKAISKKKSSISVDSVASTESVVKKSFFDFDTAFTKNVGITITEIEYYPPTIEDCEDTSAMQVQCKKPSKGGVKRMKQTIIGANVKGESHTRNGDTLSVNKQNAQTRKNDKTTIKEQTITKRTFHWWYYVVLLGMIALLYIARAPILNFIRKILTGCRRIL